MARWGKDRYSNRLELWYVFVNELLADGVEEGSESTTVNGDEGSERLASELGPGCQSLPGTRNVNIESLYEVRSSSQSTSLDGLELTGFSMGHVLVYGEYFGF